MNIDTGGIYPSREEAFLDSHDDERVVEVAGEPDAVAEVARQLEERAKSLGQHRPGQIPSARALRRLLDRQNGEQPDDL